MHDRPLTVGSLFSGIGGIDLGLERAGMRVIWQCEIDKYARRVLSEHWPSVPCYPDVRKLCADGGEWPEPVDVLCGGFPCQDISTAGRRAGIHGERSGLFFEIVRLARALRPRYILLENVAALTIRGLDTVLGELALCGYDAEWDCISAASVGALHRRDRLFIVAYRNADGLHSFISEQGQIEGQSADSRGSGKGGDMAYPMLDPEGMQPGAVQKEDGVLWGEASGRLSPGCGQVLADASSGGRSMQCQPIESEKGQRSSWSNGSDVPDADQPRCEVGQPDRCEEAPLGGNDNVPDAELAGTGHITRAPSGQGRQPARALEPEALRQGDGAALPEGVEPSRPDVEDSLGNGWSSWGRRPSEEADPRDNGTGLRATDPENAPYRRSYATDGGPGVFARKPARSGFWATEPDVGRVANGVPSRVDRLKCLGNAVVPQVAEYVGRCIVEYDSK